MDTTISLVRALAWPVSALLIAALFRGPIADVIDRLSEFSAFGVSAKIRKQQERVVREVVKVAAAPTPALTLDMSDAVALAADDPAGAVEVAWRKVVKASQDAHTRLDPAFNRHGPLGGNIEEMDALIEMDAVDSLFSGTPSVLFYSWGSADNMNSDAALSYIRLAQALGSAFLSVAPEHT